MCKTIKTDILLTHAGHASLLIVLVGPIIQPEVGPIISPRQEVGPIIFWLQNFRQMCNLVIFIYMSYVLSLSSEDMHGS